MIPFGVHTGLHLARLGATETDALEYVRRQRICANVRLQSDLLHAHADRMLQTQKDTELRQRVYLERETARSKLNGWIIFLHMIACISDREVDEEVDRIVDQMRSGMLNQQGNKE